MYNYYKISMWAVLLCAIHSLGIAQQADLNPPTQEESALTDYETPAISTRLISYNIQEEALSVEEQIYLDGQMESDFHENYTLATLDPRTFELDEITLELAKGIEYTFQRDTDRDENYDPRQNAWIGRVPGTSWMAHFAWSGNTIDGHIQLDDLSYVIRAIGNGKHAIIPIGEGTAASACGTTDAQSFIDLPDEGIQDYGHPDLIKRLDEDANTSRFSVTTGECKLRVLVIYTTAADADSPNILDQINNLINIANTGYILSGVTSRIELAAAIEDTYSSTGNTCTDLANFRMSGDGLIDAVFANRNLWDADYCSLIVDGGGGCGYVSLNPNDAFSVTGDGNFSVFTFHHELGHNALCTHDLVNTSQPGTAPYAGWGEPTTGCYRTIMAYQPACGTGSCTRNNVFSDNTGTWNCGGNSYPRGTINNRNTDRINLSDNTIVDHRTVGNNTTYGGDYDFNARESVHFVANDSVGYTSSVNKFELFSGSEGSFRASYTIKLGRGFHARSGTSFVAYLENCTPIPFNGPDDPEIVAIRNSDNSDIIVEDSEIAAAFSSFPNPADVSTTLQYFVPDHAEAADIHLIDANGRIVLSRALEWGHHNMLLDISSLSSGQYILVQYIDGALSAREMISVVH